MNILATAAQMRELDRTAIEDMGIPSLELMENAATAAAEELYHQLPRKKKGRVVPVLSIVEGEDAPQTALTEGETADYMGPRVAIFCGPGNNGGDGVAAARLLMGLGCEVRAFLVGDRGQMTPDCKAMEGRLMAAGGVLEEFDPHEADTAQWLYTCDGIMDAMFGVGLNREVGEPFRSAIQWVNRLRGPGRPVVACDIPSGIHADTGNVMGVAVKADVTVTFSCAKPGLYLAEGRAYAGKVRVETIGIPRQLIWEQIEKVSQPVAVYPDYAHLVLPRRPRTAHKGDFGKVFILAGSEGYTGAPVLAANGAVRSGAGLVFLGVPRDIYPIVAVKCDEAMPFPLPEDYETLLDKAKGCDIALLGPGLGRSPRVEELVLRLLQDLEIPVVLDADGINALSGHIDILDKRSAPTVLTPHDGEFQRLTGCELPIMDRLSAARDFGLAHNCVLVLKGHTTITAAPDGRAFLNATGNPGMAKGGCGDVLAGMLAGLLGQKHLNRPESDLAELVAWVVFYHGKAGDRCAGELGEYGMTPSDMLRALPLVLKEQESDRE